MLGSVVPTVEEGGGHPCDIATVIYHALGKAQRWKIVTQKAVQVRYSQTFQYAIDLSVTRRISTPRSIGVKS